MSLSLAVSGRILTSDPSRRRTSSGYRLTGPTDRRGSVLLLAEALPRPLDLLLGVLAAVPAADLGLLLLEVLVDREEVGDLVGQLLGQVAELLERVPGGIGQRHAQDLVVDALLVRHLEQRDRLDLDHAAGERRLGDAHHRVELVAVLSQRLGKVAVVGRVDDRGVQEAIELDGAELLVPLVLVAAPLGDLDEAEELGVVAHGAPRVLGRAISLAPMRRTVVLTLLASLGLLLAFAASALAAGTDDGEGWVGEADDRIITFFSLGVVAFFPIVVTLLSLLQAALDRRKERRKAAALRRRAGW